MSHPHCWDEHAAAPLTYGGYGQYLAIGVVIAIGALAALLYWSVK